MAPSADAFEKYKSLEEGTKMMHVFWNKLSLMVVKNIKEYHPELDKEEGLNLNGFISEMTGNGVVCHPVFSTGLHSSLFTYGATKWEQKFEVSEINGNKLKVEWHPTYHTARYVNLPIKQVSQLLVNSVTTDDKNGCYVWLAGNDQVDYLVETKEAIIIQNFILDGLDRSFGGERLYRFNLSDLPNTDSETKKPLK